jgi:hypothetical protein
MIQISALRSRLEKQPTDLRPYASYIRDDALIHNELWISIAPVVLLLVDVINDFAFPEAPKLLRHAISAYETTSAKQTACHQMKRFLRADMRRSGSVCFDQ